MRGSGALVIGLAVVGLAGLPAGISAGQLGLVETATAQAPAASSATPRATKKATTKKKAKKSAKATALPVLRGCTPRGSYTVRHGPSWSRKVALTFDDGPGPMTSKFLDVLRRYRVPATFFLIGQNIAGRQALVRRMVREGHALGNHTWNHPNVAGGNAGQLTSTSHAIRAASGVSPCVFRPPGGSTNTTLGAQARSLGMVDVLWSVDTSDWRLPGSTAIAARALAVRRGGIVLMHDGGGPRGGTLAALPKIITGLRARGYRLVTVPDLLRLPQRLGPTPKRAKR